MDIRWHIELKKETFAEIVESVRANAYRTAIARKALSAPVRYLQNEGLLKGRVLDYGCGKGSDASLIGADKYDPHFFPTKPRRKYDTIICVYVLNVVTPKDAAEIVESVRKLLKADGVAWFAVRRDIEIPHITARGTLQYNVNLPTDPHCARYSFNNKFAIYRVTKK